MVAVFKTNVTEESQGQPVLAVLQQRFPSFKINFDLEDCDKILRVEAPKMNPSQIIEVLHAEGYRCEILE